MWSVKFSFPSATVTVKFYKRSHCVQYHQQLALSDIIRRMLYFPPIYWIYKGYNSVM